MIVTTPRLLKAAMRCLLFLVGSASALAQELPMPAAHYTLHAKELFRNLYWAHHLEAELWDVSGHGLHGQLHQAAGSNELTETNFLDRLTEPNGSTSLEKKGNSAWIEIPSPFGYYNPNNGFSLTFWIKREQPGTADVETIMTTPYCTVTYNEGLAIALETHDPHAGTLQTSLSLAPGQWYFVAVVFEASTKLLSAYAYPYTTPFQSARESLTLQGTRTIFPAINSGKSSTSLLMGNNFLGSLHDVKFFKTTLTTEQLNAHKNQDRAWAQEEVTVSRDMFINTGAFMHFPLDQASQHMDVNEIVGTPHGSITHIADRFGNSTGASCFNGPGSYIELPRIFGNYDPRAGLTVSFWMYLSQAKTSPEAGIELPFNDGDARHKIFFASNAAGQDLFGMQYAHDRLGELRYTKNTKGEVVPWWLWNYDPVSLKNRQGWYHVVLVQEQNQMKTYIASMEEAMACECDNKDHKCWEACGCDLNYQGMLDLSAATRFGIGSADGEGPEGIDDFRVYHWSLNRKEVHYLHKLESQEASAGTGGSHAPAQEETTMLACYPNPATEGHLNLLIYAAQEGRAEIEITIISGAVVEARKVHLKRGENVVDLDVRNYKSGVYIISTVASGKRVSIKAIISNN